ncbi:MAG: cobalamin-dependent protein [Deltaproteobacteria bacterium]|nr:cobalamin-dependent protein [Deltaproteobacteria bacterium]
MASKEKIKVLLAQFPLETHSRGLITVAGMLRDSGMEVVLLGNALPEQIVETAVQEYADVIGISTYCGGELALGKELMTAAENRGIKGRTIFLIGGIFPPKDIPELKKIGFHGAFLSATKEQIVSCIEGALAASN